jgi:hypothetical protein
LLIDRSAVKRGEMDTVRGFDQGARLTAGSGMKKKKTEIIVERDQVLVIRHPGPRAPQWCASCGEQAQMVSVDEAAAITRLTERTIYQQVESGQIHFSETTDGSLLVCLNALLNQIRTGTL